MAWLRLVALALLALAGHAALAAPTPDAKDRSPAVDATKSPYTPIEGGESLRLEPAAIDPALERLSGFHWAHGANLVAVLRPARGS